MTVLKSFSFVFSLEVLEPEGFICCTSPHVALILLAWQEQKYEKWGLPKVVLDPCRTTRSCYAWAMQMSGVCYTPTAERTQNIQGLICRSLSHAAPLIDRADMPSSRADLFIAGVGLPPVTRSLFGILEIFSEERIGALTRCRQTCSWLWVIRGGVVSRAAKSGPSMLDELAGTSPFDQLAC